MDLITNPVCNWHPSNIYYRSVDCNESINQNIEWNYDPFIAIFTILVMILIITYVYKKEI